MFRALRSRNYRLFFAGQGISLVGTWLTKFAMGYDTYELSGSPFQLGVVAFFSQMPTAIVAPYAGVLADRWDRRRALVVTQVCAALQSAALAAFALTGTLTVFHLLWLGAIQAVINAFDMPIRQSFVRYMVDDRADLPNAIALNSSLVNIARLAGPVVAAVLVELVGIGWCFTIDAMSYLAVIGSLIAMRVPKHVPKPHDKRVLEEFVDGLRYVRSLPLVKTVLLLFAVGSVFGGAYSGMLPAVAEGSLHGGTHALGAMMGAAGGGALLGAFYLANRTSTQGLEKVIVRCAFASGTAMILLELAPNPWLALPAMVVLGGGLIVQFAATNTLIQTVADDDKLGRVMSLYAIVFFAGAPTGALIEGAVSLVLDPIHVFALAGLGVIAGALVFGRRILRLSPEVAPSCPSPPSIPLPPSS